MHIIGKHKIMKGIGIAIMIIGFVLLLTPVVSI